MVQSKAAMYGVLAVVEVARRQATSSNGVQAHDIAKTFSLPVAYCAKVMSQLARAGIFQSGRGPRGGFKLQRQPDQITLLDIVSVVNGQIAPKDAMDQSEAADPIIKSMNVVMHRAFDLLRQELQRVTIADFLKDQVAKATSASVN
jgi:Rrf2 family protein